MTFLKPRDKTPPRLNYACVDLSTNLSWTVYQLELYLYVWEFCNCRMIKMTDPKNDQPEGIGFVDIEQDFTATAPDQSIQSTDKLINSN